LIKKFQFIENKFYNNYTKQLSNKLLFCFYDRKNITL
jgi:hypothetical protein